MSAHRLSWRSLTALSSLAAVAYWSWPLGYVLNPRVGARGLASELEGSGQPYNWLFVLLDILSSLLVLVVCIALWRHLRRCKQTRLRVVVACFALFAALTILDALLPLPCAPSIHRCGDFLMDPLTIAHGASSIMASVFLFVSLLILWWWERRTYPVLMLLMIGYIIFAIFSLIALQRPGRDSWSQHYYITLCSFWIALLPGSLRRALT